MSESFDIRSNVKIAEVSADQPCLHCGKPDWCFRVGELSACKRGSEPAPGWEKTSKSDKDGTPYYAPTVPKKAARPKAKKEFFYYDRDGANLIKVTRTDDGEGNRKFYQSHWNGERYIKGVPSDIQKSVPIYRYQQVRTVIATGRPVFMVEGEGCADALSRIGICATTTLGGSGKYRAYGSYQEDLAGAALVLCPDRDEPGVKHMEEIAHDFLAAQWLYAPPGDFYWQHLAKSGGLDVVDWLASGAKADDIRNSVGEKLFGLPGKPWVETADVDDTGVLSADEEVLTAPTADEVFTQKAIDALYSSTRWISVDNNLYRWTGTHYKLVSPAAEKARIAAWCNSTAVQSMRGWSYAYAKAHIVNGIYDWLLVICAIDPELVNPPGLNCLNGVLKIHWQGKQPTWELVPRDPEVVYTYVGEFEFDPNADPEACDRLLSCLEPEQQQILIQTLAASLDLKKIRRLRKQRVRALICKGDGNNGKDSLREAVQLLYGVGVVSTTVSDFHQYDHSGRKFALAKLEHARVSWASENSSLSQLDSLPSLRTAITGETLSLELKQVQEREMTPNCIFLFNINDAPNLQASLEAMQSRWAVLSFNKTFKTNADSSRGEVEADPRFRYDPDFLQREVVPGLLNKMLAALAVVATKEIDYSCTEAALKEIQIEGNHLRAFCQDVGLDYQPDGVIYAGETWKILKHWYIENGTLEITVDDKGKEKEKWNDQSNPKDKNVRGSNSILGRLHEIFPKAQRGTDTQEYKNRACLKGIGFGEASEAVGEAVVRQTDRLKALLQDNGEAGEAILTTLAQVLDTFSNLSYRQQLAMKKLLFSRSEVKETASPASPSASSKDSLPNHCLTNCLTTASPAATTTTTTTHSANSTIASPTNSPGAVTGSVANSGGFTQDNSTKNFPPASLPKFKVGDKCRAKHPHIWGLPGTDELTIISIDDNIATVTFNGCRSITGVNVPLSDLEPVEEGK